MFIQTEPTPNPATMKFLPGRTVLGSGTMEFVTPEEAAVSPLASALFAVEHVSGVFFGGDFVAVTKSGGEWQHLKPAVLGAIMDHFTSGQPLVRDGSSTGAADVDHADYDGEDAEIVAQIKDLLDTRVRPAVAQDGGDILFDSFDLDTGVLSLRMRGACAGCPSSSATLKAGVEQMMKHYVPEVTRVEQVI